MITTPVDIDIRIDLLRRQAFFSQLSDKEIGDLARLLVEKHFNAGDTIVTEGEPVNSFYLLLNGKADVQTVSYENSITPQIKSIATLSADKYDAIGLNESGFYSLTGLRTATVVAKTDIIALYLSLPVFHGFCLANPHVSDVMREQSSRFLFRR